MNKWLVAGLGNIGEEYAHTRHNIGFDVVDDFVAKHGGAFTLSRLALVSEIKWKGHLFVVIKPTTYMNLSGKAFKYWLDKEKIAIENTITIVDDLSIPIQKIRIRPLGTHGGHNGLRDIEQTIGTTAYPKIRFGIGNNFPKGAQVDFVLGKWATSELAVVSQKRDASVTCIENIVSLGIERAMALINNMTFKQ